MTWLLALFGAEVVKVESLTGGDYARTLGGVQGSPLFASVIAIAKSFVRLHNNFSRDRVGNMISRGHVSVTERAQPGECLSG